MSESREHLLWCMVSCLLIMALVSFVLICNTGHNVDLIHDRLDDLIVVTVSMEPKHE